MILSFHPCFEGDRNILCAGRAPDENDQAAVRAARAVILPQGCPQPLFEMVHCHGRHVFPDYRARFRYPGKTGQIRLFQETGTRHPDTRIYNSIEDYTLSLDSDLLPADFKFPVVFKLNWGGEGETVFWVQNPADLSVALQKAGFGEAAGRSGFLLQTFIPGNQRALRVAVIGRTMLSYWRVQQDPAVFGTSLAHGAVIDSVSDPQLQAMGIQTVSEFCRKTGINLAGFDLLLPGTTPHQTPYFLEINYFFGRRGLGGSERFYAVLNQEIRHWIKSLPAGE